MHGTLIVSVLLLLLNSYIFSACSGDSGEKVADWPEIEATHKPWTYWWWPGSAVDKGNLTYNLELYQQGGMGGVHIVPIYGVKGYEEQFIDYLTPKWMEMLAHTVSECQRLGINVDMTIGTGWPFGGPMVTTEFASARLDVRTFKVQGPVNFSMTEDQGVQSDNIGRREILASLAFSESGQRIDIDEHVNADGVLSWQPPPGNWTVYALVLESPLQRVKRAAPGAEGNVLDPYSVEALDAYLGHFDEAFATYQGDMVRAFYHDSFEYFSADWTRDLLQAFEKRRGYDLLDMLPAFLQEGSGDITARIKSDYRQTISELHEEYILRTTEWSHEKGALLRNQAHGSPTNILDLYAAADIPECETFGASRFDIPGLRRESEFVRDDIVDPLMLKFSSSAAHVTGKSLVASESCTWLADHFRVSLSQVKPEIDQLFLAGINHIGYHGMAYSPESEPWPGWQFYASTSFAPTNSIWRDMPLLNGYVARCQSVLQYGEPDNELLVYFPIFDIWHEPQGRTIGLSVHRTEEWLHPTGFYRLIKQLKERGYSFDYISDKQLKLATVKEGEIRTATNRYKAVIVPSCRFMPIEAVKKLKNLLENGAKVVFIDKIAKDVPGYFDLEKRREEMRELLSDVPQGDDLHRNWGEGQILVGDDIVRMLDRLEMKPEHFTGHQIDFIRRRFKGDRFYFLANQQSEPLDTWVQLAYPAKSVVILDPLTGRSGLARLKTAADGSVSVYLQVEPGATLILKTMDSSYEGPQWIYLTRNDSVYQIAGEWAVEFIAGGPTLPGGFRTRDLTSWAHSGDPEAERFAGTARYRIKFRKPEVYATHWILDLGIVRESALVRINGEEVGRVWSLPFRIPLTDNLKEGENEIEIEVTNLSANRIRDLDRRGVVWKKFYNINFVNIHYQPFDASGWELFESGLLGPVRLYPAETVVF